MAKEYWDTCLWIAYVKDSDDERTTVDIVDALLRGAQNGERLIVVSTLVLLELRSQARYNPTHWRIVRDIFYTNRPYIRVVNLNPRLADLGSTIGAEHSNLTPPDAGHVATALSEKVDVFLTLDGKHEHGRRRTRDLLDYNQRIGNPPLRIEAPQMPLNSQLPFHRPTIT
jgi:predicted nucleic acid-binding protein